MDRSHLLELAQQMLVEFKKEIEKLWADGESQAEIDAVVNEFEELYAPGDDPESDLVMAVLRQAARQPN